MAQTEDVIPLEVGWWAGQLLENLSCCLVQQLQHLRSLCKDDWSLSGVHAAVHEAYSKFTSLYHTAVCVSQLANPCLHSIF